MDQIKQKATDFSLSYGRAMGTSLDAAKSRHEVASDLASHYAPDGTMSFSLGSVVRIDAAPGAAARFIDRHLTRFEKSGWGYRITLVKHEVMFLSAGSAACWLTWSIDPKDDTPGWQWTNMHGFRLPPDGKGGFQDTGFWEYIVSDNEVGSVLQRRPDFFQL